MRPEEILINLSLFRMTKLVAKWLMNLKIFG